MESEFFLEYWSILREAIDLRCSRKQVATEYQDALWFEFCQKIREPFIWVATEAMIHFTTKINRFSARRKAGRGTVNSAHSRDEVVSCPLFV